MLSLLPGRLLFEQGFETRTRPLTNLDPSEITTTLANIIEVVDRSTECDEKKAVIYGLIDTILELIQRTAEAEHAKGNTAALPFKQEIAAPLEELEDLLKEMRGDD